jgi:hypothetical protein
VEQPGTAYLALGYARHPSSTKPMFFFMAAQKLTKFAIGVLGETRWMSRSDACTPRDLTSVLLRTARHLRFSLVASEAIQNSLTAEPYFAWAGRPRVCLKGCMPLPPPLLLPQAAVVAAAVAAAAVTTTDRHKQNPLPPPPPRA